MLNCIASSPRPQATKGLFHCCAVLRLFNWKCEELNLDPSASQAARSQSSRKATDSFHFCTAQPNAILASHIGVISAAGFLFAFLACSSRIVPHFLQNCCSGGYVCRYQAASAGKSSGLVHRPVFIVRAALILCHLEIFLNRLDLRVNRPCQ